MKKLLFMLISISFLISCEPDDSLKTISEPMNAEIKNALQGQWNGDRGIVNGNDTLKGNTFFLKIVGDSLEFPLGTCLNESWSEGPDVKCFYEIKNNGKTMVIYNTVLKSPNGVYLPKYNFDIKKQYTFSFTDQNRPAFLIESKDMFPNNPSKSIIWNFFLHKK
jgi:hypothetical protein